MALQELNLRNRRYLGAKTRMLDFISDTVSQHCPGVESVADIFAGTGVVADLFKSQGKKVVVNDLLTVNYISYNAWFGSEEVDEGKVRSILERYNAMQGIPGYATENFGGKYFSVDNAEKIDAIREAIEREDVNQREHDILLTSLVYAIDKVANTVGHYDAYRKKMTSFQALELRMPVLTPNKDNEIYQLDANELVRQIHADLVYIDPPYNSRGYENAYHVLENIAEWKKPEVEGVAVKAVDRSKKSSDYTKKKAPAAFRDLIEHIDAKYILVSYNNMESKGDARSNAKTSGDEISDILSARGSVEKFATDFQQFTTGKSHIADHQELLYLCAVSQDA